MASDLEALRQYVTAQDGHEYDQLHDDMVVLNIQHSLLTMSMAEIRLSKSMPVGQVKDKIYRHCGTKPDAMTLSLLQPAGQPPVRLAEDARPLGYYGVAHGMTLYVQDTDPFSLARNGGLEDCSLVTKYEMSEDDYATRDNTVRRYKQEQLAKDPNWTPKPKGPASFLGQRMMPPAASAAEAGHLQVGARCQVRPGARRGTLAFLGAVPELDGGIWAGVAFDEPVGRGNGSVKGTSYFKCGEKFGGFIRPLNVATGDFPERDPLADDDSSSSHSEEEEL